MRMNEFVFFFLSGTTGVDCTVHTKVCEEERWGCITDGSLKHSLVFHSLQPASAYQVPPQDLF